MTKLKPLLLLLLIFLALFACSKKNEQQQNINAENLQQLQEQEIEVDDHQYEIVVDEQLKKQFEAEKSNTVGDPVYIFEQGKYNILVPSVNIRSQPNLTSSVIGKMELHSEIEIIERVENFQTIEGMTHYWYKVKYKDITGYIWGGFISIRTEIFLLGDTKFHCYYRVSKLLRKHTGGGWYFYYHSVTPNDIFIYMDQKRIKNTAIEEFYSKMFETREYWYYCEYDFYEKDGNIVLNINDHAVSESLFIINKNGEIIFVKSFLFDGL